MSILSSLFGGHDWRKKVIEDNKIDNLPKEIKSEHFSLRREGDKDSEKYFDYRNIYNDKDSVIGKIYLHGDGDFESIFVELKKEFQGKGFTKEIVFKYIDSIFKETKLNKIHDATSNEKEDALALLGKLGERDNKAGALYSYFQIKKGDFEKFMRENPRL